MVPPYISTSPQQVKAAKVGSLEERLLVAEMARKAPLYFSGDWNPSSGVEVRLDKDNAFLYMVQDLKYHPNNRQKWTGQIIK